MGSRSIKAFSIVFALVGVAVFYFSPETFDPVISMLPVGKENLRTLMNWLHKQSEEQHSDQSSKESENAKVRLFTADELRKYDGGPDSVGLYLAILGEVFDVSKGAQHYKPGASYSFFAGRDASRAYLTGDFTDEKNADDVSGLDDSSLTGLMDWLTFYQEEYPFIGRMVGRYYDSKGNPTEELERILKKIEDAKSNKWLEDKEKEIFPPCNSEWSKEKGSRVWCTKKSGGIERNWVGVPRQYYQAGKDPRCVCVRDSGPPSNDPDGKDHKNLGDLEYPNLQEYPDCPKNAVSCKVDHP